MEAVLLWVPRWIHDQGERPLTVVLEGVSLPRPISAPEADLAGTKTELQAVIEEAEQFAAKLGEGLFLQDFSQALALSNSEYPVSPYHPDILPARGYSLLAQQVMAAAIRAWVFGGMGSWNDLDYGKTNQKAYRDLTSRLYGSVVHALVAATNSFAL